jgi:ParB family chromosome partitioning protein
MVPVAFLHSSPLQPRRKFDQEHMDALVESVRAKGIIQPIVVRRHPEKPDAYEIVAGERRWRAAQVARLHDVPVIIKELSDRDSLEIALIENVQRRDLNPLEEAEGYRRLLDEFDHGQEDLARSVGKSRSHVANMIRLLNLPDAVKDMVSDGALTAGHARALLNAGDAAVFAGQVVKRGLNVRQTERLVQRARNKAAEDKKPASDAAPAGAGQTGAAPKDADLLALERRLSNSLGLKAEISFDGKGGMLSIHYRTLEQLDDVLKRLNRDPGAADRRGPVDEPGAPSVVGPDQGKAVASPKSDRQIQPVRRPAAFGPPRAVPSPKPEAEGPDKGTPKPAAPARLGGSIISPRRDDGEK